MLTPEEKQAHGSGMTGSKMARIITGKFGGAFQVWHEMKRLYQRDEEYSKFLEIGNALEPVICREYSKATGHDVVPVSTIYAEDDRWYRCHIDRKIVCLTQGIHDSDGVLEVKAANAFMGHEWADGPPDYPLIQCLFGMHCTGFTWGAIAVIKGGYDIAYWDIERDDDLIKMILGHAEHFRSLLDSNTPPPVDGSNATSDVIKSVYKKATFDGFTLDSDHAREDALRLYNVKHIEKLATTEKQRLQNIFKMHIQDREGCHVPGFGNITWKNTKTTEASILDADMVQREYPEIYKACCRPKKTGGHRVFNLKPDKTMVVPREEQTATAFDNALTCIEDRYAVNPQLKADEMEVPNGNNNTPQ